MISCLEYDVSQGVVTAYPLILCCASDGMIAILVHFAAASWAVGIGGRIDGKTQPVKKGESETLRKESQATSMGWNRV